MREIISCGQNVYWGGREVCFQKIISVEKIIDIRTKENTYISNNCVGG